MKKLIIGFCCFFVNMAFADSAAMVLFVAKSVNNATGQALARGTSLQAGDSVITGEGALAKIKYTNGTLVTLGEKTTYKIIAYSPKQGDVEIKAELTTGKLNIKTERKTKEELKTPTVALAISGTQLNIFVPVVSNEGTTNEGTTNVATTNVQVIDGDVFAKIDGVDTPIDRPMQFTSENGHITAEDAPFPAVGSINATPNGDGPTPVLDGADASLPETNHEAPISDAPPQETSPAAESAPSSTETATESPSTNTTPAAASEGSNQSKTSESNETTTADDTESGDDAVAESTVEVDLAGPTTAVEQSVINFLIEGEENALLEAEMLEELQSPIDIEACIMMP